MTKANRWVRYSAKKVPLRTYGKAASSTDPGTWSSLAAVRASKYGEGIGFVLNGDGIVCLDLDHCLVDGEPTTAAEAFLSCLPRTYIEVSPSGEGLHVWGLGWLSSGFRRTHHGVNVEGYGTGRYITVTERVFSPGPLADLSEILGVL